MLNFEHTPPEDLRYEYMSREIEQRALREPELRMELVDGQFLVGGTILGSCWLLREVLEHWGMDAVLGFAPLEDWWAALRMAYGVDWQRSEDWSSWAEGLPLGGEGEPLPLLGSRHVAAHRWVRDRLQEALASAVSQGGLGKCFGPRFGMWIGAAVFTPDLLVLSAVQLAENPCYDRFVRGAAMLVVEVMLPEWTEIDTEMRWQYYQRSGVLHYWTVDLGAQAMQFWRWTAAGYELGALDGDGSYRGLAGLTVTPELLWVEEGRGYPRLPIVVSEWRERTWHLEEVETTESLGQDGLVFLPRVGLEPVGIEAAEFVAWCPEGKLEGGALIGGGEWGTKRAIGMLLMSLGLVAVVRLLPGYEWVRGLRQAGRKRLRDGVVGS